MAPPEIETEESEAGEERGRVVWRLGRVASRALVLVSSAFGALGAAGFGIRWQLVFLPEIRLYFVVT